MFCMENGVENVYGKIKSYGEILLYFCEIGNMKKYLTFYMTSVNGHKLEKYKPRQWVIVIDKYDLCQWVIVINKYDPVNGLQ